MPYYKTCDKCGSNLDPGEKCDCEMEEKKQEEHFAKILLADSTGQISFLWNSKERDYAIKSIS